MTTTNSSKIGSGGGFQRWVKLSTDDLPLIRPPRHHMLAHVTGGLEHLYEQTKSTKKESDDEIKIPYHETDEYREDVEKGITGETEAKNGHSEEGESGEGGEEKGEEKKKEGEEQSNNKEEANTEDTQKKEEKSEEEPSADKKEKNSQNEKKDDEGGGEGKSKSNGEEEEEEEEEGKQNLSKTDDGIDLDDEEDSDDEEMEGETTPYTDEEGEFVPKNDMPLLAERFKYTEILARGQSAIIIKVLDTFHKDKPLAIKVLHRVYKPIGSQEADILLELHRADPWLHVPFARLLNQFLYGPHYCLVFEYLSPTPLYTHYDQRDIREAAALPHIRDLTVKLLTVLGFLYKQNVIHADLKPENILLRSEEDLASLMVVDFGNALRNTDEELSLYYSDFELQTLLYRAPEVIFGMKFSLEVDMWSLGCLLAECYLGEPLFMGKSKKEILNKITDLLGPFPKEFNDGEYAEEFADFIGRPMSRYQRLENLRKRLSDCKDSMFLMLVERLLTYLPDRRFTPFEAACHPFVACSTPFLYLTPSPGYVKYPTVLLDMSTYPYLPGLPDDDDEDSASAQGRKRLALFTRHKKPQTNASGQSQKGQNANQKDKDGSGKTATRSDVKETLKSMGLRCEDFTISVYSREQAHAILKKQGVEVTPNNLQTRDKHTALSNRGGFKNAKSGESAKFSNMRTGISANTRNINAHFGAGTKDDDDDCVILDPPDAPKSTPRLPQQFQLMGTTVQVNRGAKRGNRPMVNQPQAKRSNARPMMYYRNEHEQDGGSETSVQDTLKRLKNYNISITCRRNASGMRPQGGAMDSESDMENDIENDSDDDGEDMTKYLECQIGEVEEPPPAADDEIFDDDFDIDCDDKDDDDYNPRGGKKKKSNKKSPRKGKKKRSSESSSAKDKTSGRNSGIDEFPDIVPSVEMSELSDQHVSNPSENEYEQDPLAEENDTSKELQDILENAAELAEGEVQQGEEGGMEGNTENQTGDQENAMDGQEQNPENDLGNEMPTDEMNENKSGEDLDDSGVLGEFVQTSEEGASSPPRQGNMGEEEIDEELENEMLTGGMGEAETEMEQDL